MKKANLKSMNKQTKSMLITYAMVIAVFIIVEIMISTGMMSSLMQGLLVPLCIYSIVAVGLNLCVGYLGELSLGHAGFMCVGAFSSAVFSKCMMTSGMNETLRFILAILIGTVVAAIFGWLIGIPVLRLRGDYLAIVTLAFGEIIKNVINVMYLGRDSRGFHFSIKDSASLNMQADGKMIIDGAKGIVGTPNQSTFVVGIIIILISLFVSFNLVNSRTGRAIMAIRDNRIAAESVGINITKYGIYYFCSYCWCRWCSLCTQSFYINSPSCKLWLQHVHHDSCICCLRWNGKFPWFYYRGRCSYNASGSSSWTC